MTSSVQSRRKRRVKNESSISKQTSLSCYRWSHNLSERQKSDSETTEISNSESRSNDIHDVSDLNYSLSSDLSWTGWYSISHSCERTKDPTSMQRFREGRSLMGIVYSNDPVWCTIVYVYEWLICHNFIPIPTFEGLLHTFLDVSSCRDLWNFNRSYTFRKCIRRHDFNDTSAVVRHCPVEERADHDA